MATDFSALDPAGILDGTDGFLVVRPDTGDGAPLASSLDDVAIYLANKGPILVDVPAANKWRLRAPSPASRDTSLAAGVGELRFLDSGSTNLVGSGAPISSGVFASPWTAAAAFDGNTGSNNGWYGAANQAAAANTWIGYDFGTPTLPAKFSVCPINNFVNALPPSVILEFYDEDAGLWITVRSFDTAVGVANTFQTFDFPAQYLSYQNVSIKSKWVGANFLAVGDSMTAATAPAWAEVCSDILGTNLSKIATSGWTSSDGYTNTTSIDTSATSLIAVLLGTNDFGNGSGVALGASGDTHSSATFYGYYEDMVKNLLTDNKFARLVLITPLHRTDKAEGTNNSAGFKLKDYRDAIIAIGEKYGLPVYDAWAKSGFSSITNATITSDGLHPSAPNGYAYLGRSIAAFLATC